MKHDAIKKYTSHQMRLKWRRTYFALYRAWQRSTICGHQTSEHRSGPAASWPLDQSRPSINQKDSSSRMYWKKNPDGSSFACVTEGEDPSRSCKFASEQFHCKEENSSRDSSWSVTSPIQIILAPPCREMSERLGGEMTNTRKVMWNLIRKTEIFG